MAKVPEAQRSGMMVRALCSSLPQETFFDSTEWLLLPFAVWQKRKTQTNGDLRGSEMGDF